MGDGAQPHPDSAGCDTADTVELAVRERGTLPPSLFSSHDYACVSPHMHAELRANSTRHERINFIEMKAQRWGVAPTPPAHSHSTLLTHLVDTCDDDRVFFSCRRIFLHRLSRLHCAGPQMSRRRKQCASGCGGGVLPVCKLEVNVAGHGCLT